MDFLIALACFPVVFVGELPDKTMFANLLMATRGHPVQVWLGSSAAFAVHVAIATTVGVEVFNLLPRRAVDGLVAATFAFGAAYAWLEGARQGPPATEGNDELRDTREVRGRGRLPVLTAFVVIFLAEWGDLTQILVTNLAARYHAGFSVAVGSWLAMISAAAIAVLGGRALLRWVRVEVMRKVTAVALLGLSCYTAWLAVR